VSEMSPFGRWLQQQLDRIDMNRLGLAQRLGLAHPSVYAWFSGEAKPSPENIMKLSQVLGVPIEDIYRALGILADDHNTPEDVRRLLQKIRALPPEDRQLVEGLMDQLLKRLENQPDVQPPDAEH
jgi:transcriptional regulator with XRE-family HTH domain